MNCIFEEISEEYRKPVIDILNYYILNTSSAYREDPVGYDHFDNFLNNEEIINIYVIKDNTDTIGFCMLEFYKNISTFKEIGDVMYFLDPEYTGMGIGSRILKKLENDAIKQGIHRIVVDISDENEQSIVFHKKNGFMEYGRLQNCWEKNGKRLGMVLMEKKLVVE